MRLMLELSVGMIRRFGVAIENSAQNKYNSSVTLSKNRICDMIDGESINGSE